MNLGMHSEFNSEYATVFTKIIFKMIESQLI